jgi:hypothetical protein
MAQYDFLSVSNGSGDSALAHVTTDRLTGDDTLLVDTVVNWPSKFIGTYGTLLSTGFIDPTTKRDFRGHLSGSDIIIDAFEPGNTDAGTTSGQVVVVKPNTGWADRVATFIKNATGNGTPEAATFAGVTSTTNTVSGNETVGGTLGVTGASTFTGAIGGAGYSTATISNPYKFHAYRNAGFTTGSPGLVQFDTELFDTNNNFDVTTNIGRYTIPVTGFYWLHSMVTVTVNNTGAGLVPYMYKNGSLYKQGASELTGDTPSWDRGLEVSTFDQFTAGDYVEIYIYGSGYPASVGSAKTYFMGYLVSKT